MKWDVDFQCFVIRGDVVSRGRQTGRLGTGVEWMQCNGRGYIRGVLFVVDGGFCVGNELSGFQAASSCIEYGQRAGFRAWEWAMDAEHLRPRRVYARHI